MARELYPIFDGLISSGLDDVSDPYGQWLSVGLSVELGF
uniref:Uncharacterized protein n=1 Tax=Rhizophora mucronata TaxID=61149 RepID=A0A2P2IVG8_RHIMU